MFKEFIFHYGIPSYNFVYESINNLYNIISFNVGNIIMGYNLNTLYFYENNPNVYLSSFINTSNNLNGTVIWKYNILKRTFYNYNCSYKDTNFLPILTATIKLHDKPVYDLTDFLINIKVESSNLNYPTLNYILGVFEYTTGIILSRNESYVLEYMDDKLNIKTVNLFDNISLITNCQKN
uniref:Uncharacterized protein n=1 Tax=viral metagenome TaxID=1070528 RepID=A0A6C0D770_9ZZZZ